MNYDLIDLLSYSIIFAAIIGIIKFKKVDRRYQPFIFLIWLGLCNEGISTIVTRNGYSNAINLNVFYLLDAILLLLFFKKLELFKSRGMLFRWMLYLYFSVWIIELSVLRSIDTFSSYFVILYAFATVIMSINLINQSRFLHRNMTLREPLFLICLGFIIFYTYSVLIEIFWIYGLNATTAFRLRVYRILAYINLAVNIIYGLALLWIPRKRESLLL